jgi:hypothetical protein
MAMKKCGTSAKTTKGASKKPAAAPAKKTGKK